MLIYHNVNSAFASVASLDFGVCGGCLYVFTLFPLYPKSTGENHQQKISANKFKL
jgi:hypothetical protein